jgi:hypothetical protein
MIMINTRSTRYWRSVPQENKTSGRINGNAYAHCSASAKCWFGYMRIFLVFSIQVHSSIKLLLQTDPEAACTGAEWLGWGEAHGSTSNNSTLGRSEQRTAVTRFLVGTVVLLTNISTVVSCPPVQYNIILMANIQLTCCAIFYNFSVIFSVFHLVYSSAVLLSIIL